MRGRYRSSFTAAVVEFSTDRIHRLIPAVIHGSCTYVHIRSAIVSRMPSRRPVKVRFDEPHTPDLPRSQMVPSSRTMEPHVKWPRPQERGTPKTAKTTGGMSVLKQDYSGRCRDAAPHERVCELSVGHHVRRRARPSLALSMQLIRARFRSKPSTPFDLTFDASQGATARFHGLSSASSTVLSRLYPNSAR